MSRGASAIGRRSKVDRAKIQLLPSSSTTSSFTLRRGLSIAVLVATALAGCSLFTDLSEYDQATGLDGGDASEGSTDGNAVTTDGPATSDTGSDAGSGSTCSDGGFCDDFDELPLGARWSRVVVQNGGALSLDDAGLSPPFALRPRTTVAANLAIQSAYLEHVVDAIPKSLSCSFALRIHSSPLGDGLGPLDVLQLSATAPGIKEYYLRLGQLPDGTISLREDLFPSDGGSCGCPRTSVSGTKLTEGGWTQLSLYTDFTTARVSFDGVVRISAPFVGFTPSTLSVLLGAQVYGKADADVSYDDVACSFTY